MPTDRKPKTTPTNFLGDPICGADVLGPSGFVPCPNNPEPGHWRCYRHGGKNLKGAANRNWRHGRYAKHLPLGLLDVFLDGADDEELGSLRDELRLLDMHLVELVKRLKTGENKTCWIDLHKAHRKLQAARQRGPAGAADMVEALEEMGRAIEAGAGLERVMRDLHNAILVKTKVADAEHRRLVVLDQLVDAKQFQALVSALVQATRQHVADTKTLAAINEDFIELLRRQGYHLPGVATATVDTDEADPLVIDLPALPAPPDEPHDTDHRNGNGQAH